MPLPHRFGNYIFDRATGRLLNEGQEIPITRKQFLALGVLLDAQGGVVTRAKFFDKVWPGSVVEESNVTQLIFTLRRLLGKLPNGEDYIETVPKIGYRMAADALSAGVVVAGPAMMTPQRLPKLPMRTRISRLLKSLFGFQMTPYTQRESRDAVVLQPNRHSYKHRTAA